MQTFAGLSVGMAEGTVVPVKTLLDNSDGKKGEDNENRI